jgi:hypothetical protein
MDRPTSVAELLAALTYGERKAAERARSNLEFAPSGRARAQQGDVAEREDRNWRLMEARLAELGSIRDAERFAPFFDEFFEHTEPADWLEAQTFHYVGDAWVSDLAEVLVDVVDPVSAEILRHTLGERHDQESFALDELHRALQEDGSARERIAAYSRRIVGEALTQTREAVRHTTVLRDLMGGEEGEKALVLRLLERHRARLDRLGVEPIEP